MKTDHGYYIKPTENVYDAHFEVMFGFGPCNSGFDDKRVVYFPTYKPKETFEDALKRPLETVQYREY